jgi:hypothetical protein
VYVLRQNCRAARWWRVKYIKLYAINLEQDWWKVIYKLIQLLLHNLCLLTTPLIVICVSRPKSASFLSESEFSGRGAAEVEIQARTKGTFWQRCTLHFLGDRTNYKAKTSWEKLQIHFV